MRRAGLVAGAFTATAVSAALIYLAAIAPSATGYKAQTACSALFVSGRSLASLDQGEFEGLHPLLALVRPEVNLAKRQVSASLLGLGAQTAIFRPGLGCTLVEAGATLPPAPAVLATPVPRIPDAIEQGVRPLPPGADARRFAAAISAAFAEPDPENPRRTRALLVLYDGRLIAERYAPGFTKDMPLAGYSLTKTMTGALAGILAGRGELDVNARAAIPEWQGRNDGRAGISVDDLLHMTSGLDWSEDAGNPLSPVLRMAYHSRDMAAFAANRPQAHPPGARFRYSSGDSLILSRLLRASFDGDQQAYLAFPRAALFAPAGMASAVLAPDASGTLVGGMGAFATARDWARLGELYRNEGVANGRRVLPENWVTQSNVPQPASAARGYGQHIWVNRAFDAAGRRPRPSLPADTLLMNGQFGQLVAVSPSRKVTIVRLGETHGWNFARDPDQIVASILAALPGGVSPNDAAASPRSGPAASTD